MFDLKVTELADQDLDEILHYIAIELAAPQAASTFADAVEACYDRIKSNPLSFEISKDPRLVKEGFRRAIIKNYIMLYKVVHENSEVVVYRFFYCRRDYANFV